MRVGTPKGTAGAGVQPELRFFDVTPHFGGDERNGLRSSVGQEETIAGHAHGRGQLLRGPTGVRVDVHGMEVAGDDGEGVRGDRVQRHGQVEDQRGSRPTRPQRPSRHRRGTRRRAPSLRHPPASRPDQHRTTANAAVTSSRAGWRQRCPPPRRAAPFPTRPAPPPARRSDWCRPGTPRAQRRTPLRRHPRSAKGTRGLLPHRRPHRSGPARPHHGHERRGEPGRYPCEPRRRAGRSPIRSWHSAASDGRPLSPGC